MAQNQQTHKGMQAGMEQVLDRSSRGLSTANMPADRTQGVGMVAELIPASL